ncbi:type II secretion system protein GspG [Puniceicoccaceae bacterium K14]|nr:type II secretion system protein GspG [Puniceicoccaceae bacterium K14]
MTLIEIVLVIALIVAILGFAVGNLGNIFGNQQVKLASLTVKDTYDLPLTTYRVDMGSYPNTALGLKALITKPQNDRGRWRGPYLKDEEKLIDPWGNPYQYVSPGTHNKTGYDLSSWGPDGVASGDDIKNW